MRLQISRTARLVVINIAALIFASALVVVKMRPDQKISEIAAEKSDRPGTPLSLKGSAFDEIMRVPIFSQSRMPVIDTSAIAKTNAVVVGEPPVLVGVVGENGLFQALLEDAPSNTRKLLKKGEIFNGWTLTAVGNKKAEFQAAGRTVVQDLSVPRPIANNVNVTPGKTK